jgi:hypothetical protein
MQVLAPGDVDALDNREHPFVVLAYDSALGAQITLLGLALGSG